MQSKYNTFIGRTTIKNVNYLKTSNPQDEFYKSLIFNTLSLSGLIFRK